MASCEACGKGVGKKFWVKLKCLCADEYCASTRTKTPLAFLPPHQQPKIKPHLACPIPISIHRPRAAFLGRQPQILCITGMGISL